MIWIMVALLRVKSQLDFFFRPCSSQTNELNVLSLQTLNVMSGEFDSGTRLYISKD